MRKFFVLFGLFLIGQGVFAGRVSLYVNNQPYNKPVFTYKGQVFVDLEDVAAALRMKLVESGRVLCGTTAAHAGPACPSTTPTALLYLNGKPVVQGVSLHHGKVWLSLAAIANPLGYYYDYNPQTGIADLVSRAASSYGTATAAVQAGQSGNAAQGKTGQQTKKGEKQTKDPLQVSVDCPGMCYPDPRTYEIRLSFVVTNVSNDPVNGITATLEYRDNAGNPANKQTFSIGSLDPGKSVTEYGYWIDSAEIPIQPHVDLDWQGKEKQ